MEDMQILELIKNTLEDHKADDVRMLDLRELTVISDYFVICSGNNTNQVKALADHVEETLAKQKMHPRQLEGYETANWILMDYGNIIIHVFDKEARSFYDLDRIWSDAPVVC